MANSHGVIRDSVIGLWRYPVKSMIGEQLDVADMTNLGLVGDRAYALVDRSNEKVVSAKNPRKWPQLLEFRAAFLEPPRGGEKMPAVRITLPNGRVVTSEQGDCDQILSEALGREVTLASVAPKTPSLEEYWPDMEDLAHRDTVTDESIPVGTFFDAAVVHVVTTATLDRLRELHPQGRFEIRRFRPNVLVEQASDRKDFIENGWVGRTLKIGTAAQLSITGPCPRCVMTTLPQGDLPADAAVLRSAAQHNQANVGVYASVAKGATVRRGDPVTIQ